MSLAFNDVDTLRGIVQIYERELGYPRGYISGDTTRLKEFTAEANLALDDFIDIAIKNSGTWQFDDSNHTDYPTITHNLTSGQRDYPLVTDGSGNLTLDIFRVLVADSGGTFHELKTKDQQQRTSENQDTMAFVDGTNTGGMPTSYDKTGNGIIFDLVPNYTVSNGIKVLINREGSYFTSSDTTKKPGVPGLFHRWFAIKPAYVEARMKSLASADRLAAEVFKMEEAIADSFGKRERDIIRRVVPSVQNTR